MKKLSWILLLLLSPLLAVATHQVGGYFSIKYISGTTYRITLYDYTNTCNTEADRDTVRIYWGDGSSTVIPRKNGARDNNGFPGGEPVCNCRKVSIYDTLHTFPGPGSYHMSMDDQDRMANILNMTYSVNQDFYLFSTLTINPFVGYDVSSPVITYPMVCVYACPNICYTYNLGAYSPQGDSLSYALGNCLVAPGVKAVGYTIPSGVTLDPATGTFRWCSPPTPATSPGIYNFVILVISHKKVTIGNTVRTYIVDTTACEFELLVEGNCRIPPPVVTGISDTCVVAGDLLNLSYRGTDTDPIDITMQATGDPFTTAPPATYTTNPAGQFGGNPITLNFKWATNCAEVRKPPYQMLVQGDAIDTGFIAGYQSTDIYIVGPAPTNLVATPHGNAVNLSWNASTCSNVTGYEIYRHTGCYKWIHDQCETGVPAYTGYTLIGRTSCWTCTTFTDNNGGRGLAPGVYYDYMVVATYPLPDGSLSLASNDTCVKLKRDVPVIINVSVDNTSAGTGAIFVRWTKPLADPQDFDTIANPGPYTYQLLRAKGINGNSFIPVTSFTSTFFKSSADDTTFKDTPPNTLGLGYSYKVLFYSNNTIIDSSAAASSIYLTVKPDNNMLHLSWQSNSPWTDSSYSIYRTFPLPVTFLHTVPGTQHTYTDSNLTNLKTFCYYVESKSYYPDSTLPRPLFDSSEIMCGEPKDTVPPCRPKLSVNPLCDEYRDSLVWNNPDYTCPQVENRVLYYNVYFTPSPTSDLNLIATIHNLKDTVFVRDSILSIAGCFAVTAVDSFMNESAIDTICVDNCPEYELPNVFTPNGDGANDLFTPILPYRFIKDVDMEIFDRWGVEVLHTLDPMINWNGKMHNTGADCSDGVYFYICRVHEIHINGIQTRDLKGFIQLLK